jgi:release factor glutamine methyltransferase
MVEEVSGLEGGELHTEGSGRATRLAVSRLDTLVERRLAGEPVQYVLGRWGFRTLDLFVDRRVLIPRPETEVVVDHVLAAVDRVGSAPGSTPVRVVDLGTGSGAIALAVGAERDGVEVWGTDVSPDALAVARANLAGLGRPGRHVRLVEGSWFDALPVDLRGTLHVVVSNPPYVADDEPLPPEVERWEPAGALRAGPTGLEAIERILDDAVGWLAPGGTVVVEMAPHQAERVAAAARRWGYEAEVAADLAGLPRVAVARLV